MKNTISLAIAVLLFGGMTLRAQVGGCSTPIAVTPTSPYFEGTNFHTGVSLLPPCWTAATSRWVARNNCLEYTDTISNYDGDNLVATPWLDISSMPGCSIVFRQLRQARYNPMGIAYVDTLRVLYRTGAMDVWQNLATFDSPMDDWARSVVSIPGTHDSCQIAFKIFKHLGRGCSIDDLHIGGYCFRVADFTPVASYADHIVLTWRDTINLGASYLVNYWDDMGDTLQVGSSDTSVAVTGLGGCTHYHFSVAASCVDSSRSLPLNCSGRTAAGTVHIPFSERFEGFPWAMHVPPGWSLITGLPSTNNDMLFYGSSDIMVALPPSDQPTGSLQLRFLMKLNQYAPSDYSTTFSVGYMTNLADSTTYVNVASWDNDEFYYAEERAVVLAGAPDSARIVLRVKHVNTNTYWTIDNIVLEFAPNCTRPLSVIATSVTDSSTTVYITGHGINYRVYWSDGTSLDSTDISDSVCVIGGFNRLTEYTIFVATICADGSLTPSVGTRVRTGCGRCPVPYFEDFESTYIRNVPTCWTVLEGNPATTFYSFRGGFRSLCLGDQADSAINAIALPQFNMPTDSLNVGFWLKTSHSNDNSGGSFLVGYMTDLSDDSSFVALDSWTNAGWDTGNAAVWMDVHCSNASANAFIVFRHESAGSNTQWYVDSVVVERWPPCRPPTQLNVINAGAESITVTVGGSRTGNYRLYITDGFSYNDTALVSTTRSFTFTGLSQMTTYTISAVSDCGDEVSIPVSVTTTTVESVDTIPTAVPYATGFEMGDDIEWRRQTSNNNIMWRFGTAVASSGSRSLYISDDNGTSNHQNHPYARTYTYKTFSLEAGVEYTISYDWRTGCGVSRVALAPTSCGIDINNPMGNTGVPAGWIPLDGNSQLPGGSDWQSCTRRFLIDSTGDYKLVFYWSCGITENQPPLAIDNVSIDPITCPAVHELMVNRVGRNDAVFSWTPLGSESEWAVDVNNQTTIVGTNSFHAENLDALTTYTASVRPICGDGDTGDALYVWFTTVTCEGAVVHSNHNPSQSVVFVNDLPIGPTHDNYSYAQTIIPADNIGPYGRLIRALAFTPLETSDFAGASINGIEVYMANVGEHTLYGGFILPDDYHRFVHVISDADFSFNSTSTQIHAFDTMFTWDGHSNILISVLRHDSVSIAGAALPSYSGHMDNATLSRTVSSSVPIDIHSVEGGTGRAVVANMLLINCPGGCSEPRLNDVVADGGNVTISFDAEDTIEVCIAEDAWNDTLVGILLPPADSSFTFSNLLPMQLYYVGIRQRCNDSTTSYWVVRPVTTLDMGCMPPSNFTLESGTYTSQTFSWIPTGNATACEIRVFNETTSIVRTSTASPFTVSGLYPGITYSATIRSLCGEDRVPGPWGDTLQFATTDCQAVTGVHVDNIQHDHATVSWQPGGGSHGYRIYYGSYDFYDFEADVVDVPAGITTYTMTDLCENSIYEVYVLNRCADGVFSCLLPEERIAFSTLPAGIENLRTTDSELLIYPNPASGSVTVRWPSARGQWTVEIVDLNGKRISELRTPNSELQINLGRFAPGSYFLRVTDERQTIVRKLIVR